MKMSFGGACSPIDITRIDEEEISFNSDTNEADIAEYMSNKLNESKESDEQEGEINDLSVDEDITDMVFLTKRVGFNIDKYKHEESIKFGNR